MTLNHFNRATQKALAAKGIQIVSLTTIPGEGDLPFANGETGYCVNDNGTHRVWTFRQVLAAA